MSSPTRDEHALPDTDDECGPPPRSRPLKHKAPVQKKKKKVPALPGIAAAHKKLQNSSKMPGMEDLDHLPPDEWMLAYVKRKNEQYADNVAESVAKLVLSFLKVVTSKYDSIATLRDYIQDTHKKEVMRFLAERVVPTHSCRKVSDKYVSACYMAICGFATLC